MRPFRTAFVQSTKNRRKRASLEFLESRALLATFTVVSNADSGTGTLREAIELANQTPASDTILFTLPAGSETITLDSALPDITNPLLIIGGDPNSDGSRKVAIVAGSNPIQNGLTVLAGGSTIQDVAIGGFQNAAIRLQGANANIIAGNFLGLTRDGTAALPNRAGISISNSGSNLIGGTSNGSRNYISGNTSFGIEILDTSSIGNVVQGNWIGTDHSGNTAIPNGTGILIGGSTTSLGATANTIGGTATGARNVISGNSSAAIQINNAASTGNIVQGNYLGINFDATPSFGNSYGILINGAISNTIGGTTAAARNVISGNSTNAILIDGGNNNVVSANFIGIDPNGTVAWPNGNPDSAAVVIRNNASGNRIGGTIAAELNVISGNLGDGISLEGGASSDLFPRNTVIQGNRIGTDSAGTAAITNGGVGIALEKAIDNTIGGTASAARNIISGNASHGILLKAAETARNVIQNNYIGTKVDGVTSLGNAGAGVRVEGAVNTVIGETATGTSTTSGNTIAFNSGSGVRIIDSASTTTIRRNSIFDNLNLGIDIGEEGPDPTLSPVITIAQSGTSSTFVQGTIQATASKTYVIDIYSNTTADPSGYGQGKTWLGSTTVTTNASGFANWSSTISPAVATSLPVSATWTLSTGGSSEFALDVTNSAPTVDLHLTLTAAPSPVAATGNIVYTLTITNTSNATATNVTLSNTLGTGVSFIGGTSTVGGSIVKSGQVITYSIGNLAPGATATIVLNTVAPSTATSIVNNATVTSTEQDSSSGDNSATNTTQSQLGVNLVVKTTQAPPTGATANSNLAFIVSITNTAAQQATNVVLTNPVPAGTTFVSGATSSGTISQNAGIITGTIGTIAAGATVTVTLVFLPTGPGTVVNTAHAASNELEIFPNNNTSVSTATVGAAPSPQPSSDAFEVSTAGRRANLDHTARFFVTFNEAASPQSATNFNNYRLVYAGHDGVLGTKDDIRLGLRRVMYDNPSRTVTLLTTKPVPANAKVQLKVRGIVPLGVRTPNNTLLDGSGSVGSPYTTVINGFSTVANRLTRRAR
jgi:uncharacterized repeat protein (TIGR01451 family)